MGNNETLFQKIAIYNLKVKNKCQSFWVIGFNLLKCADVCFKTSLHAMSKFKEIMRRLHARNH